MDELNHIHAPVSLQKLSRLYPQHHTQAIVMSVSISLNQSDVDRLLDSLERLERSASEVRQVLGQNLAPVSTRIEFKPPKASISSRDTAPDLSRVKWKLKGGLDANPEAEFAYAFTADQKGSVYSEVQPVLEYLKSNGGKSSLEGYELTVSQNGKFLNRKYIKK